MSGMARQGLISLRGMDRAHLEGLLDRAQSYVGSPVSSDLAGATVTTAFFEASTRTRLSFERAAHRLGAHVMDLRPDLSSTVNAGVGRREHPTQTLIDALTLRQEFGHLDGLRMAIVGDIRNSRVARGHLEAFPTLGMELTLVGPTPFLLAELIALAIAIGTVSGHALRVSRTNPIKALRYE